MKQRLVTLILTSFLLLSVVAATPAQAEWVWGWGLQNPTATASQSGAGATAMASFAGLTSSSGGTIFMSQALTSVFPANSDARTATASVSYTAMAGWGWNGPSNIPPSSGVTLTLLYARGAAAAAASPTGASTGASSSVTGIPTASPFVTGGKMSLDAHAPNGDWGSESWVWGGSFTSEWESRYVVDGAGVEHGATQEQWPTAIPYTAGKYTYFGTGGRLKGHGLNFEDDATTEIWYSVSTLYADHVRRWNIRTHGGPIGGDGQGGGSVSLSASGGDSSAVAVYGGILSAH